jgi:hypothetical protein
MELADASAAMRRVDAVFVWSEAFDSLDGMVGDLLEFRRIWPKAPLVLLSCFSQRDDLSTSRAAICDVTLSLPVAPARITAGVQVAIENNKLMTARSGAQIIGNKVRC